MLCCNSMTFSLFSENGRLEHGIEESKWETNLLERKTRPTEHPSFCQHKACADGDALRWVCCRTTRKIQTLSHFIDTVLVLSVAIWDPTMQRSELWQRIEAENVRITS